ncbi:hypothetical protein O3P69_000327 [Scylla paramamosain]|uniref:Uncharacterized protein n=1 Tax=Scylla paramamosain TaxID=85552 RepID=A0AAW0UVP2_SCYPA
MRRSLSEEPAAMEGGCVVWCARAFIPAGKAVMQPLQPPQQGLGSHRSFPLLLVVVSVVVVVVDWYTGAVTIFTEANTAQQYQRQLLDGSTHTETRYESWGACDDVLVSLASQTPHDTGSDDLPQRCQIYPQQIKTANEETFSLG